MIVEESTVKREESLDNLEKHASNLSGERDVTPQGGSEQRMESRNSNFKASSIEDFQTVDSSSRTTKSSITLESIFDDHSIQMPPLADDRKHARDALYSSEEDIYRGPPEVHLENCEGEYLDIEKRRSSNVPNEDSRIAITTAVKKRKKKRKLFDSVDVTNNGKGTSDAMAHSASRCGKHYISSTSVGIKNIILDGSSKMIKTDDVFNQKARKKLKTQQKPKRKRSSRYYGVCRFKRGVRCKWLAKCGNKYIGYYELEDAAASAVDKHLDTLGIDKRFRNLGSSKEALQMMISGTSSRKWKRSYAAKVEAGEVENISMPSIREHVSCMDIEKATLCKDKLRGLGVSIEELHENDEPEIREVTKSDTHLLLDMPLSGAREVNDKVPLIENEKHRDGLYSKKQFAEVTELPHLEFSTAFNSSVAGQQITGQAMTQSGMETKRNLLDVVTKNECTPIGVKKECQDVNISGNDDIPSAEGNLREKSTRSTSTNSQSLLLNFSSSQSCPPIFSRDQQLLDNQFDISGSGLRTSNCTFCVSSKQLCVQQVRSSSTHDRSLVGQHVQTLLIWRSKHLLSIGEYLTGLRMLEGKYGEITALSTKGLLEMCDLETFKASLKEL